MSLPTRSIVIIAHGKVAGHPDLREAAVWARESGQEVRVAVTWEAGDAIHLAREAAERGVDVIVAAGGDGTLNEVVNGLAQAGLPTQSALGVFPLGTANDFATGLGLASGDIFAAMRVILHGTPDRIDLAQMNDRYFINVASGGSATQITLDTPQGMKSLLGGLAYLLRGLVAWPTLAPNFVKLKSPGWSWEGHILAMAVGNGRLAGGGIPLCSRAELDDGLLDVLLVPDTPIERLVPLLRDFWNLQNPEHLGHLIYRQTPNLELAAPGGINFNLDGEPHQGEHFHWRVLPEQLLFYLPTPESESEQDFPPEWDERSVIW